MSTEAITKLAQLLQSHRIAANVVLGFILLVSAGAALLSGTDWQGPLSALPALGTAPVVLSLAALLVVSYSFAHLLISGMLALYRSVNESIAYRRTRQREAAERAAVERTAEQTRLRAERNMRSVLRHLPGSHLKVLLVLNESEDREARLSRTLAPYEVVSELTKHGLVGEVAKFGKDSYLLRLTQSARPIVAAFFEERRRQESAAKREKIEEALQEADDATRTLLALFASDEPAPGEPAHSWLEYQVYDAIRPLERIGVIAYESRDRGPKDPKHTQRVRLTEEAREPLERMILGRPVARTSVLLDLSQIASNVDRGSGAGFSMAQGIPFPRQGP